MACSIVAKKNHIKVAHVEGGIRSGDIKMPEEINRIVTDSITDYFFTTSERANSNLLKAGVSNDSIFFVGNTMIDTLLQSKNKFKKPNFWKKHNLVKKKYIVVTLHRPSNVDEQFRFKNILNEILSYCKNVKLVFPVHPRTKKILDNLKIEGENIITCEPLPYFQFNYLVSNSLAVITDSGGITEETTVMGIPCITLRNSTERPETIDLGTNELIGDDHKLLGKTMTKLFSGRWKKGKIPPLWDGNTSKRIISIINNKILFDE